LSIRQESIGFLLVDVSRLMRRAFQERLQGSDLTMAQARALVYVARNEGIRQVELAEMLEVQPITLARLIDQLAQAGLVERRPDPSDRRAFQLHVTAAAEPHLQQIEQVTAAIRAEMLRGLDKEQAATLLLALKQIHANISAR
jgi:DNA-binding MarR family transcriptional regulator